MILTLLIFFMRCYMLYVGGVGDHSGNSYRQGGGTGKVDRPAGLSHHQYQGGRSGDFSGGDDDRDDDDDRERDSYEWDEFENPLFGFLRPATGPGGSGSGAAAVTGGSDTEAEYLRGAFVGLLSFLNY
jgi:hypothetical protein